VLRVAAACLPVLLVLAGAARGESGQNGNVNLSDYSDFRACLAGPDGGLEAQCDVFDFDLDGDVDLLDFDGFMLFFSSPPGMVFVPAGAFEMGDNFNQGDDNEGPVHAVSLEAYFIDKYEVTNRRYAAALNFAIANGLVYVGEADRVIYGTGNNLRYCDTTDSSVYSRITWDGATFGVLGGMEDQAIVRVTWYGAAAYCNWRSAMEGRPTCYDVSTWACDFGASGYRLPTEAEWEMAAGWDPIQQRHFRFGESTDGCGYNCLDPHRANYTLSGDPFEAAAEPPKISPVGFFNGELHLKEEFDWPSSGATYQTQDARSYFGCYDMTGNVLEWCNDWYAADYYDTSPPNNPTGPATGTHRILRGGAWFSPPSECRSAYRDHALPTFSFYIYGFRCALGSP